MSEVAVVAQATTTPPVVEMNKSDNIKLDIKKTKSPEAIAHLTSGALAGLVSAVTLQPFDLLKTRLQQHDTLLATHLKSSISQEIKKLTKFTDFWRGTIPSTLRTSIGAGLYFTSLSKMRSAWAEFKLTNYDTNINTVSKTSVLVKLTPFENLTTGFLARGVVGYITMPITVLKTRFESNHYNYTSMSQGIKGTYYGQEPGKPIPSSGGTIRNFFKGSVATLIRDCPYAGLYVLSYEIFKNDLFPIIIPVSTFGDSQGSLINSSAAVLAATTCTTITAPFDAIKTRLQLGNETSIVKATKTLVKEQGGIKNLFRGLSLRLGRKAMSSGISWCIYEELLKSNFSQNLFTKKERLT